MSMIRIRQFIQYAALGLAFSLAGSFAPPDAAAAAECAGKRKAKKKKAKAERKPRAAKTRAPRAKKVKAEKKARPPKPVTARTVLGWWKKGLTDAEIVEKAGAAGYKPSKKDLAAFKKRRVPAALVAALTGAPEEEKVAAKGPAATPAAAPKTIDYKKQYTDEEIDFDSVPPPNGAPTWVAKKQTEEKKELDRSLRPSAPFDEKAKADASASEGSRRVVVSKSE